MRERERRVGGGEGRVRGKEGERGDGRERRGEGGEGKRGRGKGGRQRGAREICFTTLITTADIHAIWNILF